MRTSSTVENLDRGLSGTSNTISKMHTMVARAKLDPTIQKIAYWIRAQNGGAPSLSKELADAIFWWVKRSGIFTPDPFQIEKIDDLLASMAPIVEARAAKKYKGSALFTGDCDTYASWVAALGGVLGFNYCFETVKVDRERPDEYSHVYTALRVGNDWYPLDPSTPSADPGWRPQVAPSLLRRWPEKPIEDVVPRSALHGLGQDGADLMNGGNWDNPVNDSPLENVDAEYPADSVEDGQPRDFGFGPGVIQDADIANMQMLPPHDTQESMASMEPDMQALQGAPLINPSRRIQDIAGQPNDHGNPYYRDGQPQPYYKTETQAYPPGSMWNLPRGVDQTKYRPRRGYIQVQQPGTPERKVEMKMGQPMTIRRRTVSVMAKPQQVPYGVMNGMGDIDEETGILTFDSAPAKDPYAPMVFPSSPPVTVQQSQVQQAGSSVWDSISAAFKAVGTVVPAALQTSAAKTVASVTNALAGKQVLGVTQPSAASSPWLWLGAAVVLGGGAYVVMKNKGGSRRRRR